MAVINDTGDKMRDIIAKAAEGLSEDPADAAGDVVEGDADGAAAAAGEPAHGVSDSADGDDADAGADGDGAEGAGAAGKGAAGDVGEAAAKAAADKVAAEGAAKAAGAAGDAGKAGAAAAAKKDDPFEKEHGVKATDKLGRVNRIPYTVVKDRIVPNAIKKEKVKWEAEVLKPERAKVTTYEARLKDIGETEKIMFEQPRRYVAMLAAIPGYKALFEEISGGKFTVDGKPASEAAVGTNLADANDPEPQPDGKDAQGNIVGYTKKGLADWGAWNRRTAAREGAAAAKAEMLKELKPMRDRFDANAAAEAESGTVDSIINIAADWPGFKENHAAILDVVAKGTDLLDTPTKMYQAVQAAYNTVMYGSLGTVKETKEQERARYYAEFQADLRKAPRSSSAASSVSRNEPVVEPENVSSDDRMRNIIVDSVRKAGLK